MFSSALKHSTRASLAGLVILGALALIAFAFFNPQTGLGALAGAASGPTTVSLVVPTKATVGELISVKLVVNNAKNLAGFQATIAADPAQLRLTGAAVLDELSRGGRDLLPMGPVMRDASVTLGGVTCPVSNCDVAGDARSARRIEQGVYGRVELALIQFKAGQPGQYAITLSGVKLVDPLGTPLDAEVNSSLLLTVK